MTIEHFDGLIDSRCIINRVEVNTLMIGWIGASDDNCSNVIIECQPRKKEGKHWTAQHS